MPMMVGKRVMSNREQIGKLSDRELRAYIKALQGFMVSNSPMVAMTLKQALQELEWRHAENTDQPPRT